jgi:hypothetical protein
MLVLGFLCALRLVEPENGSDGSGQNPDPIFFARAEVRARHAELIERERRLNQERFEVRKQRNEILLKGRDPRSDEEASLRAEEERLEAELQTLREDKRKLREEEDQSHAAYQARRSALYEKQKPPGERAENL